MSGGKAECALRTVVAMAKLLGFAARLDERSPEDTAAKMYMVQLFVCNNWWERYPGEFVTAIGIGYTRDEAWRKCLACYVACPPVTWPDCLKAASISELELKLAIYGNCQ